jgi:hypothetical protein
MRGSRQRRSHGRRALLALAAMMVVALALPAMSQAANLSLNTRGKGVKTNKGFKLSLFSTQAVTTSESSGQSTDVTAFLRRGDETASYSFRKGVKFTAKSNLSSARLRATFLQHRGRIKMRFKATGKTQKVPVPKGCHGKPGKRRKGIMTGTFKLKADKLGTVRIARIKMFLEKPFIYTGGFCGGTGGRAFHGTSLNASSNGRHQRVDVFVQKPRKGHVTYNVSLVKFASAFTFSWGLSTTKAPRSAYTFSSNLSKGTIKSVGSQMTGTGHFSGSPVVGGSLAEGFLSGSLKVKLRSKGTLRPFKNGKLKAVQSRSQ